MTSSAFPTSHSIPRPSGTTQPSKNPSRRSSVFSRLGRTFAVLVALCLGATSGLAQDAPSPLAPTKAERIAAAQLGAQRVQTADATTLVDAVLDYPFLIDVLAYPDPIAGVARLLGEVDALAELRDRDDAEALLQAYQALPFDLESARSTILADSTSKAAYQLAELQLRSQLLEALLAHPAFLEPLLDRQPEALANAVARRHHLRTELAGFVEPPDPNLRRLVDRVLSNPRLDPAVAQRWQHTAVVLAEKKGRNCPAPPSPLPGTASVATTPGCTPYDVCNVSVDWSSEFKTALTNFWNNAYSGLATMVEGPSRKYICHSLGVFETLGQGLGCAVDAEPPPAPRAFVQHSGQWLSAQLINDGSVVEVYDPNDAAMLFYAHTDDSQPLLRGHGSIQDHSGILASGCFGSPPTSVESEIGAICLDSKWGWAGPRMLHRVGNDPYSGPYVDVDIDPHAETILGSILFPVPNGKKLDVRMFVRTDTVSLDVNPDALYYTQNGGWDLVFVSVNPASADLTWTASVIPSSASSWLHLFQFPNGGPVVVQTDPYTAVAATRTAQVRIQATLPNGDVVQEFVDVTQDGPPPPIPATPQLTAWPNQHCIYSYNNIYTVGSVPWATSYEWTVTNPVISLIPFGTFSRRAYAESAGTSGHMSVKACNVSGCSSATTVLLYFNDCSGGGGGGPL